jgi:peptidoglycan/LPS O-acetylase OafA/YrhL
MNPPASNPGPHLSRLDAVRALAILGVFFYHVVDATFSADQLPWRGHWRDWHAAPSPLFLLCYPLTFGWAGVALFFVLSGFVIHYSFLAANRRFSVGEFYRRRFWRIYPAYLLALAAFALLAYRHINAGGKLDFTLHLLLVHNLADKTFFGQINGSFWSIAIEVQFYLAYPAMLWLRRKVGMANVLGISLAIAAAGLLMSLTPGNIPPRPISFLGTLPTATWFDWVLGAFVAERFFQAKRWIPNPKPVLLGLTVLFIASTLCRETSVLSFTFASILCAVALERWVWCSKPLSAVEEILVPLGLCSYSFYLWHQPLLKSAIFHARALRFHSTPLLLLAGLAAFLPIYALSWILYQTVEKRSNAIGKRFAGKSPANAAREYSLAQGGQSIAAG